MTADRSLSPRILCVELRGGRPRPTATPPARAVLCLGNFDGVHAAHTALLREGVRLAARLTEAYKAPVACGVLCFFAPSSDAFRPSDAPPHHLTTLRDKLALFAALGVEYAYLCDFAHVRALHPEAFLTQLEAQIGCVGAVCGFNHRFGAGARGDAAHLLAHFGESAVVLMPEITVNGVTVSSSAIRELLWQGDAEGATRLLGRPYSLSTTVTSGKQLGRTLGFPTANQYFLAESLIPAHGVYAALCHTPDGVYPAVANVGLRPTVDSDARVNCESYLIGYAGDLYGRRMKTELLCFLRPEEHFPDLDTLKAAIARDADAALGFLRDHGMLPE